MRPDLTLLQRWIKPGSRIMDLGCGDGTLLSELKKSRQVEGLGIEINPDKIIDCLNTGVQSVLQDLNRGLDNFESHAFDTVIMTYALHEVDNPLTILNEMLRVGKEAIVSFPNLAYWRYRMQLFFTGRTPRISGVSESWFEDRNIHLCSLKDFENLCRSSGFEIVQRACISSDLSISRLAELWPNLLSEAVVYLISRSGSR